MLGQISFFFVEEYDKEISMPLAAKDGCATDGRKSVTWRVFLAFAAVALYNTKLRGGAL
jgi:hypothetical protein